MTSAGLAPPLPAGPPWIESPRYDLVFFLLAPLTTLPLAWGSLAGWRVLPVLGFLLAFGHYLSTFSFFAVDADRPHHRQRWIAYYLGPLALAALTGLVLAFRVPLVVQVVLFVWNTFHVSRQSCGIASLYRHRAGVRDQDQRAAANLALLSANAFCALWNVETHPEVRPLLDAAGAGSAGVLLAAAGLLAAAALVRLVLAVRRRPRPMGTEEALALVTGYLIFVPYLLVADSMRATFAMLLPHYLQYLGLVWLLQRRRLAPGRGSAGQRLVAGLAARPWLLAAALGLAGLAWHAGRLVAGRAGHPDLFAGPLLVLALVHFYLDGLFWSFRDPQVRRALGPYLGGVASPPASVTMGP